MLRRLVLTTFAALALAGAVPVSAPASPGTVAARTEAWVESVLRVDLTDRPFVRASMEGCGGMTAPLGCDALAYYDRVEIGTEPWVDIVRMERTRRDPWRRGQLLLHEILHDDHALATPVGLEEGIAEAVSIDLYAAWGRAMKLVSWPAEDVYSSSYPEELAAVRKASALATGRPWKSRAARLWRRDLWRADSATRVAMYESAWR